MAAPAIEPPLRPGARVGGYEVLGHLATGGMGEVYLARRRGIGGFERIVVLKVMLQHLAYEEKFSAMFIDEAKISSQLSHPNIVQVFDLGRADTGALFLAMEHLHGQSVAACLKRSAKNGEFVPEVVAARVVCDALSGLGYAHSAVGPDGRSIGFVHRDVSPENLFVTYAGPTKVLDFGVAKVRDRLSQTQAGEFKGKVGYMAPEIILGQSADARADLFSIGIVLFEMLTTRRLFHASVPATSLHRVLNAPIPSVRRVRGELHPELDRLVSELLQRDPERRLQSADEAAERLEAWLKGKEGTPKHVGHWLRGTFADALEITNRIVEAVEGTGRVDPEDLAEARRLGGDGLADTLVLELTSEEREELSPPGRPRRAASRPASSETISPLDEETEVGSDPEDGGWISRGRLKRLALGAVLFGGLALVGTELLQQKLNARRAALAEGTHVGSAYQVSAVVAEGQGWFRVRDEQGGGEKLLKVTPSLLEPQAVRQGMERARAGLTAADLPELPTPLETGELEQRVFSISDPMEGRPLAVLLEKEVVPPDRGHHLLLELGEALNSASEAKVVHGALDLGAVWVDPSDQVRVLGFQSGVLDQAQLVGRYRAPEQNALEPSGPPADQYALAVMAEEILKISDQAMAVRAAPILARAKAVEPVDRYRTFREFWQALSGALGRSSPSKPKRR